MATYTNFSKNAINNPKNWIKTKDKKNCRFCMRKGIMQTIKEKNWNDIQVEEFIYNDYNPHGCQFIIPLFENLSIEEQIIIYNNCHVVNDKEFQDAYVY